MKTIVILLTTLLLFGCTSGEDGLKMLDEAGYTDISLTGYNALACTEDDYYHIGFTATNPQGKRVKGTVCSGFAFKNASININPE
jgi:hypothetical protein